MSKDGRDFETKGRDDYLLVMDIHPQKKRSHMNHIRLKMSISSIHIVDHNSVRIAGILKQKVGIITFW